MAGAVRVQLRCVTGLRGRGSVQLCHGAAHCKLLQRPAKVLFAGKHACHAIEGLADPDLLIRGDRLFGCFCSVLRSNPNGERRGAAAHGEEVPGTTKSAHTGIKACMGASVRFSMEIVGGCRRA